MPPEFNYNNCVTKHICELKHRTDERALLLHLAKIDTRLGAMDSARHVHAADLEKRLEGLNQLRHEATQDRSQFVRDDVYREKTAGYDVWCHQVDNRLTTIESRAITWTAAIGVTFMILQVVMHIWKG